MAEQALQFDRAQEDVGNVLSLEHFNAQIPDQQLSTLFYVMGLGLTRDPYQVVGITNMWVNAGRCQFHLPTGTAQVLNGHVGLVIEGRDALVRRLEAVSGPLKGTRFSFRQLPGYVEAICPWGNHMRCYEPSPRFGEMTLGMPYVEVKTEPGAAQGIARFYREMLDTPAQVVDDAEGTAARVSIGTDQYLLFREAAGPHPDWDGYHVAIYLANFSGPHRRLGERGLISRETNQHEYRFIDITDLDTGRVLARLEHEVRSMRHPMYARALVNRNPDAAGLAYRPGHESRLWIMPGHRPD